MILIVIYVLVVCIFCLWVLSFPNPINRNTINAADIDRFSTVGLAKDQSVRQIAEALCEIGSGDYLDNLQAKLDRALGIGLISKMPAPSVVFFGDDNEFARGRFSSESWLIRLNSKLISKGGLIELLSVLTHEIRHAEQKYLATKYHAKVGHSENYIKSIMYVPIHIVKYASNEAGQLGDDEFLFGKYISNSLFDEDLYKKTRKLHNNLKENKGKKQYSIYQEQFANEIPAERDAYSFQRIMRRAIEDCLPRQQR